MRPILALALVLLATAGAAHADGGPSPGVDYGWSGHLDRSGKHRLVTLPTESGTLLARVDVQGGRVRAYSLLRGAWGVPLVAFDGTTGGLTRDGAMLVLAEPLTPGTRATRFAFVETRRLRIRARIALPGAFAFDALSPDGSLMYLVEYVSLRADPSAYRVRAYDVARGRLLPGAVADRRSGETEMRGQPLARAEGPSGRWVFTLYGGGHHAFVHALDTVGRAAVCVDLPWEKQAEQDRLWGARLVVRGDRMALRTRQGRTAAVISLRSLRLLSAGSI